MTELVDSCDHDSIRIDQPDGDTNDLTSAMPSQLDVPTATSFDEWSVVVDVVDLQTVRCLIVSEEGQ